MPIVLGTSEGEESSGFQYADVTGVSYEYPRRYVKLIVPGEQFVYHLNGQGYTGMGIIGDIRASSKPDHFICSILDYQPFESTVPFRDANKEFYEADPDRGILRVVFQAGVRRVRTEAFERIVGVAVRPHRPRVSSSSGYASSAVAIAVERISVDLALQWLAREFPGASITEMPHNNPGFDIVVGPLSQPDLFVEVKGTQSFLPSFFMSEGERQFSLHNAASYLLLVVSQIDRSNPNSGTIRTHWGSVEAPAVALEPTQWRAVLSR